MNPAGFLVWVTDFALRPQPQWWAAIFYGTDNQWQGRIVRSAAIAEEHAGKGLDELAALYPLAGEVPFA